MQGTKGLRPKSNQHILIPGRGRANNGTELSSAGLARVRYAAKLYYLYGLDKKGGVIVVCGYKSPGDNLGVPDIFAKGYVGVPEADLMKQQLLLEGISENVIRVERDSIDTAMNLAEAEGKGLFPGADAVMIVAQREHLQRIIRLIAPRILQREYVGVAVPEQKGARDRDGILPRVATRIIMAGLSPTTKNARDTIRRRAEFLWRVAQFLKIARGYHTD